MSEQTREQLMEQMEQEEREALRRDPVGCTVNVLDQWIAQGGVGVDQLTSFRAALLAAPERGKPKYDDAMSRRTWLHSERSDSGACDQCDGRKYITVERPCPSCSPERPAPERGGPVCVKCGRPKWQGGLCPMSSSAAAEHVYGTQVEPAPDAGDADATPHHVSGSVTRIIEGHGATLADAIKDWQAKAGGGYPLWAWEGDDDDDGREIIAGCEDCGLPIFEGENFGRDGQGIYWHIGCGDD